MLAESMYALHEDLSRRGIIFAYSGYVTEQVLYGIGEALKKKLVLEEADVSTMRNAFAIFIEQMQNIVRYSAEREIKGEDPDSELSFGLLSIGVERGKFTITCANKIHAHDVSRLDERLAALQQLDKESLRMLYKEKLRGPTEATSKGAGLGFIEIARRSTEIIDFGFMDLDDKYAFFSLKAYI